MAFDVKAYINLPLIIANVSINL